MEPSAPNSLYGATDEGETDSLVDSSLLSSDDERPPEQSEEVRNTAWTALTDSLTQIWQGLKFILNVHDDNLWQWQISLWLFLLTTAYAGERLTLKLLVDRAGPFRLVGLQVVLLLHASLCSILVLFQPNKHKLGIPMVDVAIMSLWDAATLLLVFSSASHVPPTLTVIIVQWTIPLTVLFGKTIAIEYTRTHMWGASLTTLAVAMALVPALVCLFRPHVFDYADSIPLRVAYNTLLYAVACIPAAFSQLFKESILTRYRQPIDIVLLNGLLSWYQLGICLVLTPLVYALQGLGQDKTYSNFSQNWLDGWSCFFRLLSDQDQLTEYPEEARCDFTLGLALLHVISIVVFQWVVSQMVQRTTTRVLYRGVSAGIVLAVMCMYIYDSQLAEYSYGVYMDAWNLVSLVLVILGTEIYHRESLPGSTFETIPPPMPALFYEDE